MPRFLELLAWGKPSVQSINKCRLNVILVLADVIPVQSTHAWFLAANPGHEGCALQAVPFAGLQLTPDYCFTPADTLVENGQLDDAPQKAHEHVTEPSLVSGQWIVRFGLRAKNYACAPRFF